MFLHDPSQPYTLYPKVHIRVFMFPLYLGFHQIFLLVEQGTRDLPAWPNVNNFMYVFCGQKRISFIIQGYKMLKF
jgi:hypothetical protein